MSALNLGSTMEDPGIDLGGIRSDEVMRRGYAKPPIPDEDVTKALHRVEETGVLDLIIAWRAEDTAAMGPGGRPALISDRALLTGLFLLAQEGSKMHLTLLTDLYQYRLSLEARALLGLEMKITSFAAHPQERKRWYANTARAFERLVAVLDPFPEERRSAKLYAEIQRVLNEHDEDRERRYRDRLNEFTNRFVQMTFRAQPRHLRRASKQIDISFDQTYIETPNKTGYSRRELRKRIKEEQDLSQARSTPGPVSAFAGWHVRTGDRIDFTSGQADTTTPGTKKTDYKWGWEGNFAVRVDSEHRGPGRFPALIVAATLSLPNKEVAEEAVTLMRYTKEHGLAPGIADADKQYWANSLTERLHDPAFALGFTPSTDYRIDRLEPTGGAHGARYLEGHAYCPATPRNLLYATSDYKKETIDKATFQARKEEARNYRLHTKQKPDAKGRAILRCPALGPSPTVTCPLRELAKNATKKARPHIDQDDIPDFLDDICIKHSATFDTTELRREKQAFDYGTPEWEDFHSHARQTIESTNDQIKDHGDEDLESSARRLVRGFAAAQIIMTIQVAHFNIRKIAAFLHDLFAEQARTTPTGPKPVRARDRLWHNPYTGTYPPGTTPPPGRRRRLEGDGTGGPAQQT